MEPLSYEVRARRSSTIVGEIRNLSPIMAGLFPELKGVTLFITNRRSGHVASYEWRSNHIEINFEYFERDLHNTLPFVLAHETVHAVQWLTRSIPHGERACDVFALARLPEDLFPRRKAFYVKVPKELLLSSPSRIKETACRAIALRLKGLRRYVVWFENELRK